MLDSVLRRMEIAVRLPVTSPPSSSTYLHNKSTSQSSHSTHQSINQSVSQSIDRSSAIISL